MMKHKKERDRLVNMMLHGHDYHDEIQMKWYCLLLDPDETLSDEDRLIEVGWYNDEVVYAGHQKKASAAVWRGYINRRTK